MQNFSNWIFSIFVVLFFLSCGGKKGEDIDYLAVRKGQFYGFIDRSGDMMIRPEFAYAKHFSEGLAAVNVGGTVHGSNAVTGGKWGFIDEAGNYVINPLFESFSDNDHPYYALPFQPNEVANILHEGYSFSHGYAAVRKDGQWIFIDKKGKRVLTNLTVPIQSVRRFSDSLANICVNGRWGYINLKGEIEIQPQFLFPYDFRDGLAFVVDGNNRRFFIDKKGNKKFYQVRIQAPFYEGVATIQWPWKYEGNYAVATKYGIMDSMGRKVFDPNYDQIGRYGSGMAPILVGSRPSQEFIYPDRRDFTEFSGGKWGFINRDSTFAVNPIYNGAKGFTNGLAAVKRGWLWGYMDPEGKWIYDPQFRWAGYFTDPTMALVKLGPSARPFDGRYAYIDQDGEVFWIIQDWW